MLYYTVRLILRFLFLLFTRRWVKGKENIPNHGPIIFVSNHIELVDSPLLWISLNRRAYFMAKEEMFDSKIIAYFMTRFGAFPVRKGRPDRKALTRATQVLTNGQVLIIYPEGMRSHSRKIKLAFHGAALIASRSGVPIIPIGIYGTEKIRGIAWLWRRPEITVNIGQAFTLPKTDDRLTKVELAKLTDVIIRHIVEMLPIKYRGQFWNRSLNAAKS